MLYVDKNSSFRPVQKSKSKGFMNLQKPKKKLNFIQGAPVPVHRSLTCSTATASLDKQNSEKKNNNNTREISSSSVNMSRQPLRRFLSQGSILTHGKRSQTNPIRKKNDISVTTRNDDVIINLDSD